MLFRKGRLLIGVFCVVMVVFAFGIACPPLATKNPRLTCS